jgi:signal peptidase II
MSGETPVPESSQTKKLTTDSASALPCCSGAWFAAVVLVGVLYALDQATKLWTAGLSSSRFTWMRLPQHLELGDQIPVIPGVFHWVHFSNTGAAFGVLQDNNGFFIGLSIAALGGLLWSLKRNLFPGKLNIVAVLLLMSGILGNFTDRLMHGYVVDFLLFDFGFAPFNPWPAFNVADSCICVAVVLLFIASLQEARLAKAKS